MTKKETKKKPLIFKKPFDLFYYAELSALEDLLYNALNIKGVPFSRQRYVKRLLFNNGAVGYDRAVNKFAQINGEGINDEGNPIWGVFRTANGGAWRRTLSYEPNTIGAYKFVALPSGARIIERLENCARLVATLSVGIEQNVNATKCPAIYVCNDPETRLSVLSAIEQKEYGMTDIIVSDSIANALKAVETNTPFIADRFFELKTKIKNEMYTALGILSSDQKRERVQVGEVEAKIGAAIDSVYTFIDTFNAQAEEYGLQFRMELNGSIEELYAEQEEEPETVNETEV